MNGHSCDTIPVLTGQIMQTADSHTYGGYGQVCRGTWVTSTGLKIEVAVKLLKMVYQTKESQSRLKNRLRREVKVWNKARHASIVPLLGTVEDFPTAEPGTGLMSTGMVSPWMGNGNLTDYLSQNPTLVVSDRLDILCDVIAGLSYLHSINIMHGDLNGSNVLINNEHHACLTDFGLSRIRAEFEGTSYWSSTVGGALRWRAPELLPGQNDPEEDGTETSKESVPVLTFECDVYSFGCVMLQTLSGKIPFSETKVDLRVAFDKYNGALPGRPTGMEDIHWDFVLKCCIGDPRERPTVGEVKITLERLKGM